MYRVPLKRTHRKNKNRPEQASSVAAVTASVSNHMSEENSPMTIRTLYHAMMREFRFVHSRIDTIQEDVAMLKTDVAGLKTDVATLKTDVATLKTDVATLKTDVATLKTDVATLKKDVLGLHRYNETESKIQERLDTQFVMKMLEHQHNGFVTKMSVKVVYDMNGSPISELDGALFVHSQLPPYRFEPTSIPNMPKSTSVQSLSYLFIESKHSISKGKIDHKLIQMVYIHMYLHNAVRIYSEQEEYDRDAVATEDMGDEKGDEKEDRGLVGVVGNMVKRRLTKKEKKAQRRRDREQRKTEVHPRFRQMISEWIADTELPVEYLVRPIHLLFASNRITEDFAEYLAAIYQGIDSEEQYDTLVRKLFYSNLEIASLLNMIMKDTQVPRAIKSRLYSLSMSELRTLFSGILSSYAEEGTIREYLVPFHDLIDGFQQMKGRVGYVQYGNVYYPPLFPVRSLNQQAGGPR